MTVKFYDSVDDNLIRFVVIIAKYDDKWILCRHKDRDTYEFPGGHREKNETVLSAAKRELYEETGAFMYEIKPVRIYSVTGKNFVNKSGKETFGMLFYADIYKLESELHNEIEQVLFFETPPDNWTYPFIQPVLFNEVKKIINKKQ